MLVTDQLTGQKKPKEELYKVVTEKIDRNGKIKKTTKYYTSKAAYDNWILNVKNRQLCIEYIYQILEYQEFMKIPGFFYHKIKEWEPYGFDVVYRCMCNCKNSVQWALQNKEFNSEAGKIMYLCAIFENNMNDALKEISKEKKELASFNKESAEVIDLEINNTKQTTKDISKFLEDD